MQDTGKVSEGVVTVGRDPDGFAGAGAAVGVDGGTGSVRLVDSTRRPRPSTRLRRHFPVGSVTSVEGPQ